MPIAHTPNSKTQGCLVQACTRQLSVHVFDVSTFKNWALAKGPTGINDHTCLKYLQKPGPYFLNLEFH